MSQGPNASASTQDFEFQALNEAVNYRRALFKEFGEWLKGNVLEVGAGVGQMTGQLTRMPGVKRAVAVEPDPRFCAQHRANLPGHELVQGTSADVPAETEWDAILSINVLEHIEDDEAELKRYAGFLRARAGILCLFVPARPEIYAPIDRDFGHFRRYRRRELRDKLEHAGFQVLRLNYFNCFGYFAWWVNFCVLRKRCFEMRKVKIFDRVVFPAVHALETRVVRPPVGQSLLAVARTLRRMQPRTS